MELTAPPRFLDVTSGWTELNELRQITQRSRSLAHRDGKRRLESRSWSLWGRDLQRGCSSAQVGITFGKDF